MKTNKWGFAFILLSLFYLIILSIPVNASYFTSKWYWPHQRIDYVDETVKLLNKNDLQIQFKGHILVNESIHNESDWITFMFTPSFSRYDIIENYKSSVSLQALDWKKSPTGMYESNKEANYKLEVVEYGNRIYNVSLKSLTGWNYIIFNANFTFKNRVYQTGDYEYAFLYISDIKTENQDIVYLIPNSFEVKTIVIDGTQKFGNPGKTHLRFTPSDEDMKKLVYFSLENKAEKKKAEYIEKRIDNVIKIIFLIVGAILSLIVAIIYKRYTQKDKK